MNSTGTKRFRMIRGGRAALEGQAVCAALFDLPDAESLARRLRVSANSVVRVAWSGSRCEATAMSTADSSGHGKVEERSRRSSRSARRP